MLWCFIVSGFYFCHIRWCICKVWIKTLRSGPETMSAALMPCLMDCRLSNRKDTNCLSDLIWLSGGRPTTFTGCIVGVTLYEDGKKPFQQIPYSCTQTCTVLHENRVWFKCGTYDVVLMTFADLPVGREDLMVLLKKLIRFIHIKVKRKSIRMFIISTLLLLLSAFYI